MRLWKARIAQSSGACRLGCIGLENLPIGHAEQLRGRLILVTWAKKAARFFLRHLHHEVWTQQTQAAQVAWDATD